MTLTIVSVYDRAAAAYGRPVFTPSEGAARRSFHTEVNRAEPGNEMNRNAADFDLYVLGTFEDQEGCFVLLAKPRLVCNGVSVLEVPALVR